MASLCNLVEHKLDHVIKRYYDITEIPFVNQISNEEEIFERLMDMIKAELMRLVRYVD